MVKHKMGNDTQPGKKSIGVSSANATIKSKSKAQKLARDRRKKKIIPFKTSRKPTKSHKNSTKPTRKIKFEHTSPKPRSDTLNSSLKPLFSATTIPGKLPNESITSNMESPTDRRLDSTTMSIPIEGDISTESLTPVRLETNAINLTNSSSLILHIDTGLITTLRPEGVYWKPDEINNTISQPGIAIDRTNQVSGQTKSVLPEDRIKQESDNYVDHLELQNSSNIYIASGDAIRSLTAGRVQESLTRLTNRTDWVPQRRQTALQNLANQRDRTGHTVEILVENHNDSIGRIHQYVSPTMYGLIF